MTPPKSIINIAPQISISIKIEMLILASQHATSPWFGEGRRGASLGLWRSLKGKLVVPLSLEQGRGRHPKFLPSACRKGMQATMEPLVYLLVLVSDIDLGRGLAYRRQTITMATDVAFACLDATTFLVLSFGGASDIGEVRGQ